MVDFWLVNFRWNNGVEITVFPVTFATVIQLTNVGWINVAQRKNNVETTLRARWDVVLLSFGLLLQMFYIGHKIYISL